MGTCRKSNAQPNAPPDNRGHKEPSADLESAELRAALRPILDDVRERSTVAERFIDRDLYQISIATLWANLVLNPDDVGLAEADLEAAHDAINLEIAEHLGRSHNLTECFRYLNSKPGERAMAEVRLSKNHKDMLLYFASMILDPDGHKRWMQELRDH